MLILSIICLAVAVVAVWALTGNTNPYKLPRD